MLDPTEVVSELGFRMHRLSFHCVATKPIEGPSDEQDSHKPADELRQQLYSVCKEYVIAMQATATIHPKRGGRETIVSHSDGILVLPWTGPQ